MKSRADEAVAMASEILGRPVDRVERLVASSVRAIRLHSGGETVIAARRQDEGRAKMEAMVLEALARHGAPVPTPIARRGNWVFQEDLRGERLSVALWTEGGDRTALLGAALTSLARIGEAGRRAGLAGRLPVIGAEAAWRRRLTAMPDRLASVTGLAVPAFDRTRAAIRLNPRETTLVKWDARPANAMVSQDGTVTWFDWEHCGCRDPLDDAAWLLGDEFVPDAGDGDLLKRAVELGLGGEDAETARAYLVNMGVLHMSVRLALILAKRSSRSGWRDWDTVLRLDKVGSTAPAFRRTARRAAFWAAESRHLAPLAPWFRDLADWAADE